MREKCEIKKASVHAGLRAKSFHESLMLSSQGRYNHFDTTPYELALVLYQQARAKSRGFLRKSGECFLRHGKSEEKLRVSAAKEAGTSGELFVEKCPKFPLQIPIFGAIVGRRRELTRREF